MQPYENFDSIDIQLVGGLTADIVDDLAEQLRQITPNVRSGLSYRSGVFNSWELVVGAAVAVYLGKAFIDGFLQQLGTQSAQGLTKALVSVFHKAKSKNKRLMTAEDMRAVATELESAEAQHREPDRAVLDTFGRPIPVLSIILVLDTKANPRFVFPYELNDVALSDAIAKLPVSITSMLSNRCDTTNAEDDLAPGEVYVYRSDRFEWIDARAELKAQLDAIRRERELNKHTCED